LTKWYIQTWKWKMIPIAFGIERSSILNNEIAKWFLGSKMLSFSPRLSISLISCRYLFSIVS
jgi:hypothetical protein